MVVVKPVDRPTPLANANLKVLRIGNWARNSGICAVDTIDAIDGGFSAGDMYSPGALEDFLDDRLERGIRE